MQRDGAQRNNEMAAGCAYQVLARVGTGEGFVWALSLLDSRGGFGNGSDKRLLCERGGGSSWSNARTKGCCATAEANRAINGPGRVAFCGD